MGCSGYSTIENLLLTSTLRQNKQFNEQDLISEISKFIKQNGINNIEIVVLTRENYIKQKKIE